MYLNSIVQIRYMVLMAENKKTSAMTGVVSFITRRYELYMTQARCTERTEHDYHIPSYCYALSAYILTP